MQPDGFLGKVMNDPAVSPEQKVKLYYEKCGSLYGAYYRMVLNFKEHFGTTDCFELEKPHISQGLYKPFSKKLNFSHKIIIVYKKQTKMSTNVTCKINIHLNFQ
ncbi:hypothetical protein [Desulfobacula sp.]|uniref:hypothetical protein n=1 Tax=Desulfobacula sp. TaxID=2593537 RepID=UPI00262A705F|nr:hypothetical protein [Desulfobacula sp.]